MSNLTRLKVATSRVKFFNYEDSELRININDLDICEIKCLRRSLAKDILRYAERNPEITITTYIDFTTGEWVFFKRDAETTQSKHQDITIEVATQIINL